MKPSSSVIVRTYRAPRELELCLEGLARQTVEPGEVIVAEDADDPETAAMVASFEGRFHRLVHVTQADEGFRKGLSSNRAVRRSTGDELLFLDGDAVPHKRWIADHLEAANVAQVRTGRRVKLGPELTPTVTVDDVRSGRLERLVGPVLRSALKGDTERMTLGVRFPLALVRALNRRPRKLMGVNFSLSRSAFEGVNGFDNDWQHRRPDRDIDVRLHRSGVEFLPLINRAVVYHLYHEERLPSAAVEARVRAEEQSSRVRAESGLAECEDVVKVLDAVG